MHITNATVCNKDSIPQEPKSIHSQRNRRNAPEGVNWLSEGMN